MRTIYQTENCSWTKALQPFDYPSLKLCLWFNHLEVSGSLTWGKQQNCKFKSWVSVFLQIFTRIDHLVVVRKLKRKTTVVCWFSNLQKNRWCLLTDLKLENSESSPCSHQNYGMVQDRRMDKKPQMIF